MIHINTWHAGTIVAAYIAADNEVPPGIPVGRHGNAILIKDGDRDHIVSRPRIEGNILDVVPDAADAPEMDLSGYF